MRTLRLTEQQDKGFHMVNRGQIVRQGMRFKARYSLPV